MSPAFDEYVAASAAYRDAYAAMQELDHQFGSNQFNVWEWDVVNGMLFDCNVPDREAILVKVAGYKQACKEKTEAFDSLSIEERKLTIGTGWLRADYGSLKCGKRDC